MREARAGEKQDEQGEQRLVGPAAVLSPVIEKEQSRRDHEERDGNDRVGESMQQVEPRRSPLGIEWQGPLWRRGR